MTPRALTPFFRCLEKRPCHPLPPGIEFYPAKNSGNHVGESHFLALATALLAATALVPATAGIGQPWLRWPLTGVLLFLAPHLLMTALSWVGGWISGKIRHRGGVQDWTCLAAMTVYAAWRGTGVVAAPGSGWEARICQGWLVFVGLNLLLWLAGCGRVEAIGPDPVLSSDPPS